MEKAKTDLKMSLRGIKKAKPSKLKGTVDASGYHGKTAVKPSEMKKKAVKKAKKKTSEIKKSAKAALKLSLKKAKTKKSDKGYNRNISPK